MYTIVHLHFLRGMILQFSTIAVHMHFFMFYMRICAYFGVRFMSISVEFVLGTKRTNLINKIKKNLFFCHLEFVFFPTNLDICFISDDKNAMFTYKYAFTEGNLAAKNSAV